MTDPLDDGDEGEVGTEADKPMPEDVAAADEEADEDDPPTTDDGLDVRTAPIPDDAI